VSETLTLGTGWLMLFGPSVEHATYAFLAPLLAWGLISRELPPVSRYLNRCGGILILVLGWGTLSSPLLPWAPWLLAALPLGTGCLMLGLICSSFSDPILTEEFGSARCTAGVAA